MEDIYSVGGKGFSGFMAAVDYAKANNLPVVQIDNGLQRWAPAPKANGKARVRHVIVNADGSETEFSRVRR